MFSSSLTFFSLNFSEVATTCITSHHITSSSSPSPPHSSVPCTRIFSSLKINIRTHRGWKRNKIYSKCILLGFIVDAVSFNSICSWRMCCALIDVDVAHERTEEKKCIPFVIFLSIIDRLSSVPKFSFKGNGSVRIPLFTDRVPFPS